MIYPFTRKQIREPFSRCSRVVTVSRVRPVLDLHLGGALWKDRRVSPIVKLAALFAGTLAMAALVAFDMLLTSWMVGPHAVSQLSLSSLALSGGAVLFSTITLLCLAPAEAVNLVRLERGGVIPLRTKRR